MPFIFQDKQNIDTSNIQINVLGVTFREYCGYSKKWFINEVSTEGKKGKINQMKLSYTHMENVEEPFYVLVPSYNV